MDDNNFDYYKALFFLLCCKLEINETRKQQEIALLHHIKVFLISFIMEQ